ncbi:MAG: efflux RND transporter permease subunit [Spirochaetaceae bacterium]|nr:MAG: efflux RND transporter permease subunit [Spirochaetaceae bacterium]
MRVTNFALKHRTSIFVLIFIIAVAGLISYLNLPLESFPDINQPVIFIAVPYPGVAPSDMETQVVEPIEDRLGEITKIKRMSSAAREGYASLVVEFESDIEVDEALRRVREKVDLAGPELPDDAQEPIVEEINFENIPIIVVSLTGEQSLVRLKQLAEDLQDRFEDIPGVLSADISGGLEREVKINVDPTRLIYYNLGADDVISAVRMENLTVPGGSMESGALKWTVRVPGELQSIADIQNVVVDTVNGRPIYVSDLAWVELGFKDQESYSRLNGRSSVTIAVKKRSGENIIAITDRVKEILAEQSSTFPAATEYEIVADFSEEIHTMVSDLENNIIAGMLLVILVLYFFLGARNGLLVGIAIPLSMLISFAVFRLLDYTLNTIVLYSLILALGMLVDNAVVIVENIYRQHQEGKRLLQAAQEATTEVGPAVIASTATTLLAFLPLMFWGGFMGEFMKYLPITLIITLSSSLFVGLLINPVISSAFLKLDEKQGRRIGDRFLKRLSAFYEGSLHWLLDSRKRRWVFLGLVAVAWVVMLGIFAVFNHGVEFFPDAEPEQIYVEVEAPPGTRLDVSDRLVRAVEQRIQGTSDLENYVADVGTSSNLFDFGTAGGVPHRSTVTIDLLDMKDRQQSSFLTLQQIAQSVSGVPGARIDVTRPQEGPPTGRAVEIQLRGEDFALLATASEEIRRRIADVPGLAKLDDDYEKGRPELRINIDHQKAALQGLTTAQIAGTIRTAVNGTEASKYRIGTDEYDIVVRFDRDYRRNYTDLLNLTVFHEGKHLPLANFATVELATGLSTINHVDGERVVTVSGEAIGRSSAEVLAETKRRLAGYQVPAGTTLSYAGQDTEQRESQAFLIKAFGVAVLLIFLLLVTQFNSITLPFVIIITVVLSFFGVLFGLLVTFKPFGIIMTGVGVISLAGVVVNNAIVLVDYTQKLRAAGWEKKAAIVWAGKTRLRPVLLTAVTTILGLIPLTTGITVDFIGLFRGNLRNFLQLGNESAQWWSGMGVVVIFGLLFATVLTLVVVPVMYYIFCDLLAGVGGSRRRSGEVEAELPNGDEKMYA